MKDTIIFMEKRGPKPQFTSVACPNHLCKSYGLTGEGNIVGNGTSISRGEKVRKYICRHCGKVFNDHTGTFYYDLRKEESVIDLALKMAIKGISEEAIADVLGITLPTVRRWLDRAAELCDTVNRI
jgi:transposase-like protein